MLTNRNSQFIHEPLIAFGCSDNHSAQHILFGDRTEILATPIYFYFNFAHNISYLFSRMEITPCLFPKLQGNALYCIRRTANAVSQINQSPSQLLFFGIAELFAVRFVQFLVYPSA